MGWILFAFIFVIALLWLLAVMLGALVGAVERASDSLGRSFTQWRQQRDRKAKVALLSSIHVYIPDEVKSLEDEIKTTRLRLEEFKKSIASLSPEPPVWINTVFQPLMFVPKRTECEPILVDSLRGILVPNLVGWAEEEGAILSGHCNYPAGFPTFASMHFQPMQECPIGLCEHARFEHAPAISPKKVKRLFHAELKAVRDYNNSLNETIAGANKVNEQISAFDKDARARLDDYLQQTAQLYEKERQKFEIAQQLYVSACSAQRKALAAAFQEYQAGTAQGLITRLNHTFGRLSLPTCIPQSWEVDFDETEQIAVVEIALPDVVHSPPQKLVRLKSGIVCKPLSQVEKRELVPGIQPAIILRIAYEIFRADSLQKIKILVVNGWIEFDDPSTGAHTETYTASLMVGRGQILGLTLQKLEPLVAFTALKGKSAGKLVEVVPIIPTLSLNRSDSRFVDSKEVLNTLGTETNLAAMDWQDFEHLIRELFEREFSKEGVEVKVTQASRDRGVDAVVFDPDPIKGGKFVIQAKRYTNVVDVSSVRDLCAVVAKEGASRGILVTTSTYGADAYAFANGAPVTLLNGSELLGLLKKHGYSFRINLAEAKKLNQASAGSL
jgi:Restriction endonuclease